jgi:hypothetical protein
MSAPIGVDLGQAATSTAARGHTGRVALLEQLLVDDIRYLYKAAMSIAAECYAVKHLALSGELDLRKSIWGKHVTGHPLEVTGKEETGTETDERGIVIDPQSFVLEYIPWDRD